LGPKPKKPAPTDESFLSASSQIIAGTKRKLADFFGKNRGSESAPSSPRKRFMANSALTKARNAQAQAEAEREKAAKEATALAAQMLSRENRAMKRGSPSASSKRRQAKATITTSRQTKTTVYNVRNGKFQHKVQHKVTRAGALKKPSTLLRRKPTLAKDKTTKPKPLKTVKKGVPPPKGKPTRLSLQRAATPESESENESPNITPASLRSANRLKPLAPQPKDSSSTERDSMDMSPTPTVTSVASDEEDDADLELAVSNIRGRKRGNAPPPRDMHKTGAKVTKQRHRNERGWYVKGA
jgi:palmitoyltransferase ZDHHC9/14/18